MAGKSFALRPCKVPTVRTKHRKIVTQIPVPESIPILEELRKYEPLSMTGQPLVVWDKAKDCYVFDKWGNKWLDWSSGVLVANAGHGRKEITDAMVKQARKPMHHNYCFPSEMRAALAKRLVDAAPAKLQKAFILTTGSEATECAIKLMSTYGQSIGGKKKSVILSFTNAFHGRTLGAQMIGGMPKLKEWIVHLDPSFKQVPFPDGFWNEDTSFDSFLKAIKAQKINPNHVAGVIFESYQGMGASFAPKAYIQALAKWAKQHNILVTCDEVQAGFGRSGKFFSFEHYGITPDLICCGKGITSGMPLSAVIGRKDVMDQYPPGSMTSTHTGNPLCCAAALANLDLIKKEKLVQNAAKVGKVLEKGFLRLQAKYPEIIGSVQGKGMVYGLHVLKPGKGKVADYDTAFEIIKRCIEKGLLFFSPVGFSTIKVAPPLILTVEQAKDGLQVLEESFAEILG